MLRTTIQIGIYCVFLGWLIVETAWSQDGLISEAMREAEEKRDKSPTYMNQDSTKPNSATLVKAFERKAA